MKVLVVYDTVSQTRMTEKVAQAVVAGLQEGGASVTSHFVEEASGMNIRDYDCLVVGAPTMGWKPSERMRKYLAGLNGSSYSGKLAAAFDTQLKSIASGNATKHMEKSLTDLGFGIAHPALITYVESEQKLYRLKEGEADKAKAWGKDLAATLSKS